MNLTAAFIRDNMSGNNGIMVSVAQVDQSLVAVPSQCVLQLSTEYTRVHHDSGLGEKGRFMVLVMMIMKCKSLKHSTVVFMERDLSFNVIL